LAHHGSATSSTAPFLRAAAPRWVWISAGRDNPFGHPAAAVLERLETIGLRSLRTDRHGLIHVAWRPGGTWKLELPRTPTGGR
jgi:competence protein ComEC